MKFFNFTGKGLIMRKVLEVLILVFISGCSGQAGHLETVRDVLSLAKEDKVQGKMRVRLNGQMEAGLKEGLYFGSPGSRVDADLKFRFQDVGESEGQ